MDVFYTHKIAEKTSFLKGVTELSKIEEKRISESNIAPIRLRHPLVDGTKKNEYQKRRCSKQTSCSSKYICIQT